MNSEMTSNKIPNTPTTKHSPIPWKVEASPAGGSYMITSQSSYVCEGWGPGSSVDDANAELIVRAVNSHEALVNALRAAQAVVDAIADGRPGDAIYDSEDNERLAKQVADALASLEGKR